MKIAQGPNCPSKDDPHDNICKDKNCNLHDLNSEIRIAFNAARATNPIAELALFATNCWTVSPLPNFNLIQEPPDNEERGNKRSHGWLPKITSHHQPTMPFG
jgi:hypothetical protein